MFTVTETIPQPQNQPQEFNALEFEVKQDGDFKLVSTIPIEIDTQFDLGKLFYRFWYGSLLLGTLHRQGDFWQATAYYNNSYRQSTLHSNPEDAADAIVAAYTGAETLEVEHFSRIIKYLITLETLAQDEFGVPFERKIVEEFAPDLDHEIDWNQWLDSFCRREGEEYSILSIRKIEGIHRREI